MNTNTPGRGTICYYRDRNNTLVTAARLGREDTVRIGGRSFLIQSGQWIVSNDSGEPLSIWSDSEFRKNFHETR